MKIVISFRGLNAKPANSRYLPEPGYEILQTARIRVKLKIGTTLECVLTKLRDKIRKLPLNWFTYNERLHTKVIDQAVVCITDYFISCQKSGTLLLTVRELYGEESMDKKKPCAIFDVFLLVKVSDDYVDLHDTVPILI